MWNESADRRGRRTFIGLMGGGLAMLAAGLSAPGTAVAAPPDLDGAMLLVRDTTERLLRAVAADTELAQDPSRTMALVHEVVSPHVDLQRSAQWVLGRHWARASEAQRARFVEEFQHLLMRTYATAVAENPSVQVEYLPSRPTRRAGEAVVRTRIVPGGSAPPVAVHYRLHGDAQGWKVFDVSIEGISLVTTYRASFSQRVKLRGLDGLIEDMAAKNRENAGA